MGVPRPASPPDPIAVATPEAPLLAGVGRDHALALHRVLGGVQVFGGITLLAAYGLGAPSLHVAFAAGVEVAMAIVQIVSGAWWLTRARRLRSVMVRRPGSFVAVTLVAAIVVMACGGSDRNAVYVTSAMCWLIAAGYALPGLRWLPVSVGTTALVAGIWASVDGSTGGFLHDGDYATAIIGLAAAVVPGLWLGLITGTTFAPLNRWHLVEVHERGLVQRLRAQLQHVDEIATRLAALLPSGSASEEIEALRARLAQGVLLSDVTAPATLGELLAELEADQTGVAAGRAIVTEVESTVAQAVLTPTTANVLSSVVRRQLANVVRHAPQARTITLLVTIHAGMVLLRMEDDGGGAMPFRAGTGTAWSARQLARVGGTARYYAGERGVGFEIAVPVMSQAAISDVPGLSISVSIARLGVGMLATLRYAGYAIDSLDAYVSRGQLGWHWVLMPIFAVAIEAVLRFGVPGRRMERPERLLVASALAIALTACFSFPHDSPSTLVPSTTGAVILATLIYERQGGWWFLAEIGRALAVMPLALRTGTSAVSLVFVYPAGLSLLVWALVRFVDRAIDLERTAADAVGRAALAAAAVRGLSLRHDAIDVIVRSGNLGSEVTDTVAGLEDALTELGRIASGSSDPREIMRTGLEMALAVPVAPDRAGEHLRPGDSVSGAVDLITLIELAALAADERATCAPPGILGRRRLKAVVMGWSVSEDRRRLALSLEARPVLRDPDPRSLARLQAVADTVGVTVDSTRERLIVSYRRE